MSNNTQVLEVLTKVGTSRGELEVAEIFPEDNSAIVYDLEVERRRYNPHDQFGRRFGSLGGSIPP